MLFAVDGGESLGEPVKKLIIKIRIETSVKPPQVIEIVSVMIEDIIGNISKMLLYLGILVNRLPVVKYGAAVGPESAGYVSDNGGLAGAVGAYQAVDAAIIYMHGCVIQCSKAVKAF